MFLRHERSQSCTRFFFLPPHLLLLFIFFPSTWNYSALRRRTNVLSMHTHASFYTRNNGKKKKKKKAESYFLSLRTRTANDSEPEANSSCESTPQFFLFHSFSLTLFLFVSLFLSPSLFLLNSKNKRGNFATICKANGKIIFFFSPFFSLSPFSSLKRSIL